MTNQAANVLESLEPRQMLAADHSLGIGRFNDASYASNGTLYVAWYDPTGQDLKFASRNNAGTWSSASTIDSAGDVGSYVSLAVDGTDHPAVAYYDATNADLKAAYFDGSSWHVQTIDSVGRVGMYPSLGFDGSNNPSITYYDRTHGDLKMASNTFNGPVQWQISTIDSTNDCGRYSSLAMNSGTGRWAVAYEQTTNGLFLYAQKGKRAWSITTVDDTQIGGGYISLVIGLDKKDQPLPLFSYYDAFNGDLKIAKCESGVWGAFPVASKGTVGLYSNLLLADNGGSIYYLSKSSNQVTKAFTTGGTSWTFSTVKTGGGTHLSAAQTASRTARTIVWLNTSLDELIVSDVA